MILIFSIIIIITFLINSFFLWLLILSDISFMTDLLDIRLITFLSALIWLLGLLFNGI